MNISQLVDQVSQRTGQNRAATKDTVTSLLDTILAAAVAGEDVSLPGFGKFSVKTRAAREGRNPATGQTVKIAASRKLAFTSAKALKDRLNG